MQEDLIISQRAKIKELKYQHEISLKAKDYKLEKAQKMLTECNKLDEDNQRLKRELTSAKIKLRSKSRDKKFYESSLQRTSFASRLLGMSDYKGESESRERSITERSDPIVGKPETTIEKYKAKIHILTAINDHLVNENAVLKLKLKEVTKESKNESLVHNNKLVSSIARKELKVLKTYQE